VLCLLSGGASALLLAPAAGITLADTQAATVYCCAAAQPSREVNALRKHIDTVKGGMLAGQLRRRRFSRSSSRIVVGIPWK